MEEPAVITLCRYCSVRLYQKQLTECLYIDELLAYSFSLLSFEYVGIHAALSRTFQIIGIKYFSGSVFSGNLILYAYINRPSENFKPQFNVFRVNSSNNLPMEIQRISYFSKNRCNSAASRSRSWKLSKARVYTNRLVALTEYENITMASFHNLKYPGNTVF